MFSLLIRAGVGWERKGRKEAERQSENESKRDKMTMIVFVDSLPMCPEVGNSVEVFHVGRRKPRA